jgi:hypothetical protein
MALKEICTLEIFINVNGSHVVVCVAFDRAHIVEIEALSFLDFDRHQNDLVSFHDGRRSRQVAKSWSALLKLVFKNFFDRLKLTITGMKFSPAELASIPLTFPNVKLLSSSTSVDMKISPEKRLRLLDQLSYLTFKSLFLLQLS